MVLEAGIEPARPCKGSPGFSYHFDFHRRFISVRGLDYIFTLTFVLGVWVSSLYGVHRSLRSDVPTVLPVERFHRYPQIHLLSFPSKAQIRTTSFVVHLKVLCVYQFRHSSIFYFISNPYTSLVAFQSRHVL